jgi:hypothetical protein
LSRTSRPVSNYPWRKGIQNCSNKEPGPLQRRDNYKNAKIGWGHFKIFFLKTLVQKS